MSSTTLPPLREDVPSRAIVSQGHPPRSDTPASVRGTLSPSTRRALTTPKVQRLTEFARPALARSPSPPRSAPPAAAPHPSPGCAASPPKEAAGFDRLHDALREVAARMSDATLDAKWNKVATYIRQFQYDQESIAAADMVVHLFFRAQQKTASLGPLNPPLLARVCALADVMYHWLCKFQPRFVPAVELVREKLCEAIYRQPPEARPRVDDRMDGEKLDMLAANYMYKPYFTSCGEMEKMLSSDAEDRLKVLTDLNAEAEYWKRTHRQKLFRSWRQVVVNNAKIRGLNQSLLQEQERANILQESCRKLEKKVAELQAEKEELMRLISQDVRQRLDHTEQVVAKLEKDLQQSAKTIKQLETTISIQDMYCKSADDRVQKYEDFVGTVKASLHSLIGMLYLPSMGEIGHQPTRLSESSPFSMDVVTFFNRVVASHPVRRERKLAPLEDLYGGWRMLDHLAIFLQVANPTSASDTLLQAVLGTNDTEKKAMSIMDMIRAMPWHVKCPVTADDLFGEVSGSGVYPLVAMVQVFLLDPLVMTEKDSMMSRHRDEEDKQAAALELEVRNASVIQLVNLLSQKLRRTLILHKHSMVTMQDSLYAANQGVRAHFSKQLLRKDYPLLAASLTGARLHDVLPDMDTGRHLVEFQDLTKKYIKDVVDTFRFYCHIEKNGSILDRSSIIRFAHDSGVLGMTGLSNDDVSRIFDGVHRHKDDPQVDRRGEEGIGFKDWLEALIRLAVKRYIDRTPGEAYRTMLEQHLPLARKVELDTFRAMVYDPPVQRILKLWRPHLMDIFKRYAGQDPQKKGRVMTFPQLHALLTDAKIYNAAFNDSDAWDIFVKVLDDGVTSMRMADFVQVLVAVAVFKLPAPFVPLSQRFIHFLERQLLPPLAQLFQWGMPPPAQHDVPTAPAVPGSAAPATPAAPTIAVTADPIPAITTTQSP